MPVRSWLILLILSTLIFSCKNRTNKSMDFIFPDADSVPFSESVKLSDEAIDDISRNISSPVEIADILQRMNVPYTTNYLASDIEASRISTSFGKALKLGILGADLGYINMYERTATSVDLLVSIRKLADGINVGQFFDFEAIKRLSLNRSKLDSLLFISTSSYNEIDRFLRENNRGQLSALMITGVWIEGQYLATQVLKNYPDTILRNKVGEQKVILNDLISLLQPYCDTGEEFRDLCQKMSDMKQSYRDVRITFTIGEPVMVEKDGALVVVQTDESKVDMSDDQLDAIINISDKIRNELVKDN